MNNFHLILSLTSKQNELNQQLKTAIDHDAPLLEISILKQAINRLSKQIENLEKKKGVSNS